jgi:probable HAF family extracellular repeat protein
MRRFATFAGIVAAFAIASIPAARLVATAPTYTVEDLGTTADGFVPTVTGVNTSGQVSGTAMQSGVQRAVRYSDGAGFEYLPGLDTVVSVGNAINASGDIAGYEGPSGSQRGYWFSSAGLQLIDPPAGATMTLGWGINDAGTVAGYTNTTSGFRAFFREPSLPLQLLPTLGSTTLGFAVNDNGQVAGMSVTAANVQHAFRWTPDGTPAGTMEDLGELALNKASIANAIDAGGDVVGRALTAANQFHAFRYSTSMVDIDTIGSTSSNALAVNGRFTVGTFTAADGARAFVHTATDGMIDLNTRIPADSGWILRTATGVNDKGQIVGMGTLNGVQRAYRLSAPLDTTPPVIESVTATPSTIRPPDGSMVGVAVSVNATDNVDAAPSCMLTSIAGPGTDAEHKITGALSGSVAAVGGRTYTFIVSCSDVAGNHSEASTDVVVPPDTTAPTITALSASPSIIWPPNGRMVDVAVSATATDDVDAVPACGISAITATEPSTGDWAVTGQFTAQVRAKKNSDGSAKIYTLTVTCSDRAGNHSAGFVTVTVDHDGSATAALKRTNR